MYCICMQWYEEGKKTPSEQRHFETSKWDDCTNIMDQTKLLGDELNNLTVAVFH